MNPDTEALGPTVAALARIVEICLERDGLTIQKYRVLSYLALGATSTSELAERLRVRDPVVTKLVDPLVKRGYVKRRVDNADQRRKILTLTRSGVSLRERANLRIAESMDRVATCMSVSDRRRADAGLGLWGTALVEYRARLESTPKKEKSRASLNGLTSPLASPRT